MEGAGEAAAGALMDLCANDSYKLAIVRHGALDPTIHLLRAESDNAREAAIGLLLQLQVVAKFGVIGSVTNVVLYLAGRW